MRGEVVKQFRQALRGIERPEHCTFRLVDAKGCRLGRMASQIAIMLQGKDKPTYHPSQLNGDVVVVVNAKYVELTGKRWKQHSHEWYTGYPGGKREKAALDVWKERPEALLEEAVWGMLPRNKLRKEFMRRLRIFPDEEHPLDFIPPGQGKGELSEVRLVTSRQQGEERHAILDRNTPWFWLRRHRPDGEQHWTKEIEDAKRRMDELGIEWRTGLADYHGPNGGPEGWRRHRESEQEAWERMRKGA